MSRDAAMAVLDLSALLLLTIGLCLLFLTWPSFEYGGLEYLLSTAPK